MHGEAPRMSSIANTGRLLRWIVRRSCRRPGLTVTLAVFLAILGVTYTLLALTFKTSTRSLLPQSAGYVARYAEYAKDFGELEDIVVVVEAGSFEGARDYATRLTQELRDSPVEFHRIAYRIDPRRFEGRQLLYLPTAELKKIRDKIFDYQEFMEDFAGDPSLARLLEGINTQLATAFVSNVFDLGLQDSNLPVDTGFLQVLLEQIASRLERPTPYRSPWGALLSFGEGPPAHAGYFLSEDKSLLFVLVETPEGRKGSFVGDRDAIEAIRGAVDRLRAAFPDVRVGVTGAPALSNDEMSAAFRDSRLATILAFVLTLLVMILAFRRVAKPLLMLGVLTITLAWSLGMVTLTVGHLTLFSVMFIPIVIGIGIDYGNYYLFRYREEMDRGRTVGEAHDLTAARTGPGMLISALTAGGTFLVLMVTDFRGIQELGFIAGTSLLLTWLGMITVLPALLTLMDTDDPADGRPRTHQIEQSHVPMLDHLTRLPKTVLVAAAVATVSSAWAVRHIEFDYNVLNLQAKGTESVTWEKRILATTGRSGVTGLSSADTLEELRQKRQAFEALPSVSEVDSVLRAIPDGQPEKIAVIESFAPMVAPVRIGRSSPLDLDRLKTALAGIKRRFDIVAAEAGPSLPAEVKAVREKLTGTLTRLHRVERSVAEATLNHLQFQLYRDFVETFHTLQRNLSPRPITLADLPDELRRKFVGKNGRLLLQVHPKVNIWEKEGARTFVSELRSVDPEVTGPPIITYEATVLMERAYLQGTAYAFGVVAALSLLMIRRVRDTALALLPLALGLVWTIGLMHAFGIKFNLANIWALPMLIGASAEFGLNVMLRHLEGRGGDGPIVARSTVMAVALNGCLAMIGFGSLMIASYRGIFSLGLLLTIGAGCNLLASLVVLPVVLRSMSHRAGQPASTPIGRRGSEARTTDVT